MLSPQRGQFRNKLSAASRCPISGFERRWCRAALIARAVWEQCRSGDRPAVRGRPARDTTGFDRSWASATLAFDEPIRTVPAQPRHPRCVCATPPGALTLRASYRRQRSAASVVPPVLVAVDCCVLKGPCRVADHASRSLTRPRRRSSPWSKRGAHRRLIARSCLPTSRARLARARSCPAHSRPRRASSRISISSAVVAICSRWTAAASRKERSARWAALTAPTGAAAIHIASRSRLVRVVRKPPTKG